ncbi:MAG: hypothetical protein ABIH46_04850 [Chloroflexota bacterium]
MPSDSLDQQLDEILSQVERRRKRRKLAGRLMTPFHHTGQLLVQPGRILRRPSSPGELMLVSLGLLVLAVILQRFMSHIGTPLLWIGAILFSIAFLTYFIKPNASYYEKRWRGRVVDTPPPSWWAKFYNWLYRG